MAETHKLRTTDILPKNEAFKKLNRQAEELAKTCPSASLPALDHLRMADYDLVYEPSDDTYLMVDALSWDFDHSNGSKSNDENEDSVRARTSMSTSHIRTTLEIGCGTGVSTIFLAKLLESKIQNHSQQVSCRHIVTDINQHAIRITKQTAVQNQMNEETLECYECDLATPLLQEYQNKVDVIIFNPPYVPTPDEEVGTVDIEASWAGGTDGRIVIDRALPQIASLLAKPNGVAYMITVDDNKPEQIASFMLEKYGIVVQPFLRRRARNEFLSVLKMEHMRKKWNK